MESLILQPGDICPDCHRDGLQNHLRHFLINLEDETLLKCESDSCMYPYNDEITSSAASTDDEGELESNLDLFAANSLYDNLQNASNMSNSLELREMSTLEPAENKQFELTQPFISTAREENHKPSMPFILEFKKEPPYQFKTATSLPAKKTKIEIQSITTIKTEPFTQTFTIKPSICNATTSIPMQWNAASTCGLPKASIMNGRQFLQQMEAMDKKSPFTGYKFKALKSTIKIKKERKTSDKLYGNAMSEHKKFDELSKFLLNNINCTQTK